MLKTAKGRKAGFTLIELLIVIAIIALLIGILLPALGEARRLAKKTLCTNGQRSYSQAINTYASENKDQLAAMNWRGGQMPPADAHPTILNTVKQPFGSDAEAAAFQVVSMIRRKSAMNEGQTPVPSSWISYILYSHIPLNDYIGGNLPSPAAACPEDTWRQQIQKFYDKPENSGLPYPDNSGDGSEAGRFNWRWPFSSSYSVHQSHWGPSKGVTLMTSSGAAVASFYYPTRDGGGNFYSSSSSKPIDGSFGRNKLTDVRFPSSKTIMSDEFARHNGRRVRFYADPEATQPLNFYDGSVREYRTADTNPGWDPASASSRRSMRARLFYRKDKQVYDPVFIGNRTMQSSAGEVIPVFDAPAGWYRYTRGGLLGVDVPRGPVRATITGAGAGRTLDSKVIESSELDTSVGVW